MSRPFSTTVALSIPDVASFPPRLSQNLDEYRAPSRRHATTYVDALVVASDVIRPEYDAIRQHEESLADRFLHGLERIPAWRVWGITDRAQFNKRVSTFGLTHRTKTAAEVATALGAEGLFAWSEHFYAMNLIETLGLARVGMLRIGYLHYNTAEEVDRTLDALETVSD